MSLSNTCDKLFLCRSFFQNLNQLLILNIDMITLVLGNMKACVSRKIHNKHLLHRMFFIITREYERTLSLNTRDREILHRMFFIVILEIGMTGIYCIEFYKKYWNIKGLFL